jgi:hypothetical protein
MAANNIQAPASAPFISAQIPRTTMATNSIQAPASAPFISAQIPQSTSATNSIQTPASAPFISAQTQQLQERIPQTQPLFLAPPASVQVGTNNIGANNAQAQMTVPLSAPVLLPTHSSFLATSSSRCYSLSYKSPTNHHQ